MVSFILVAKLFPKLFNFFHYQSCVNFSVFLLVFVGKDSFKVKQVVHFFSY